MSNAMTPTEAKRWMSLTADQQKSEARSYLMTAPLRKEAHSFIGGCILSKMLQSGMTKSDMDEMNYHFRKAGIPEMNLNADDE